MSSEVKNSENMFFGEKPPKELNIEYPVHRYYLEHKEFKNPLIFILDLNGKAVLDYEGNYYFLEYENTIN